MKPADLIPIVGFPLHHYSPATDRLWSHVQGRKMPIGALDWMELGVKPTYKLWNGSENVKVTHADLRNAAISGTVPKEVAKSPKSGKITLVDVCVRLDRIEALLLKIKGDAK